MDQSDIIRTSYAAVGVALIIFAAIMRKTLSGRRVLDVASEKLGLSLKVDAFGFIVLVGFVMIGSQFFLWYKGYEDKLSSLQTRYEGQLSSLQEKVGGLEASISIFKEHDLSLSLVFADREPPNINTMTWPPSAYVQRTGEREAKRYDMADFVRGPGGVVASFKKLRSGDRLYVVVEDGAKKWQSADMVAPSAQLEMHRESLK